MTVAAIGMVLMASSTRRARSVCSIMPTAPDLLRPLMVSGFHYTARRVPNAVRVPSELWVVLVRTAAEPRP